MPLAAVALWVRSDHRRGLPAIVVALALLALPAAAQDGEVVALPPPGQTGLEMLSDGSRVWVVHHPDGEVDVLGVAADRLDPDADPYVYGSAFEGIRSFTIWIPSQRIFVGFGVVFDDAGTAISWLPNEVGGAEDAGPVPAHDLSRHSVERVDEDRIRIGDASPGAERIVPPGDGYGVIEEEVLRSVGRDEPALSIEEALALPEGTTALVEADIEVSGKGVPRLCDLPRVPVPDIPSCADDAPVPLDVTARSPQAGVQQIEFGPHLVTRVDGGLAELVNGGGRAGSSIGSGGRPYGFDDDPATLDRIQAQDPIGLAVAISRARFGDGQASEAVLVRADDPADATTGAALTRYGPLLYTTRNTLPDATREELRRVLGGQPGDASTVQVIGGDAAISPAVVDQLQAEGYVVDRVAGPSRVETAIEVAERARYGGGAIISPLMLARSEGTAQDPSAAWADSVTAGGYAAIFRTPILLTPSDALHPAVAEALVRFRTEETVLLGGTAALSPAVEMEVPGPRRIAGVNRADTAATIARDLWRFTSGRAVLFDGAAADGWQAGLAAAGLSANAFAPLLVAGDTIPPETAAAIQRLCPPRGADLLAVGAVTVDPAPACPPAAPDSIAVVVTVDSRRDTPEEDAQVIVELRNTSDEPVTVDAFQISDESTDATATLYAPITIGQVDPLTVPPATTTTVQTIDPLPQSPLNAGGTTAGRYQAAVRTDRGWARATFYVEFSNLDY